MNEVLNYDFLSAPGGGPLQPQSNSPGRQGQQQYQPQLPNQQQQPGNLFPPIQRGWSGNLSVPGAAGQRRRPNNGVGNALNYDSDSATNVTAPVVSGNYPGAGAQAYYQDGQSTNDNSYARAVIPLDNKGQISLSKDGPQREFNSMSLRPNSNLSPIRPGGNNAIQI